VGDTSAAETAQESLAVRAGMMNIHAVFEATRDQTAAPETTQQGNDGTRNYGNQTRS